MVIKNALILDEDFNIVEESAIHIKDGRFHKIGKNLDLNTEGEDVINADGMLAMPGFYNAHTHLAMSIMRGLGEDLPLDEWLFKKIFPLEAKLNGDIVYNATLLATAEAVSAGIVSSTDMYFYCDSITRGILDSKMKANISLGFDGDLTGKFSELKKVQDLKKLIEDFHGINNDEILIDTSIHAEYTSKPALCKALAEFTEQKNLRTHIHVSETKKERDECIERHGVSPVKYFEIQGLLGVPATLAHCVWVDDEDLDIIKDHNATVVTNPVSNLKLASGICDTKRIVDKGINLAIGTDGVASNNSLNYNEEIKLAGLLSKNLKGAENGVTLKELLFAATRGGALSQGRNDAGIIKNGYRADMILVDVRMPNMYPHNDLLSNIVYSMSPQNIKMTIIDGNVVYKDGEFMHVDFEKVRYEVDEFLGSL